MIRPYNLISGVSASGDNNLNFGVNLAAILIASFVFGFLPFRAFLLTILKVPKPEMKILSLFFKVFFITPRKISIAIAACLFVWVTFATSFVTHPTSCRKIFLTPKRTFLIPPTVKRKLLSLINSIKINILSRSIERGYVHQLHAIIRVFIIGCK